MPVAPRVVRVLASEAGQTFSCHRRIRQRREFEAVLGGRGTSNKWFVIYRQTNLAGVSRLGIIAAKRVMPTAVARNYAKRLIREEFRRVFPVDCGLDVVVRVRRRLERGTASESRQALSQLFQSVQA